MRLSALVSQLSDELAPLRRVEPDDAGDPVIGGVSYDSRSVSPGDAFFALRGAEVDGHDYLDQALDLGAEAVVVEELPAGFSLRGRAAIVVPDARRLDTHVFLEPTEEEPTYTDASHHMGTTRMSVDPREGVVDRDCRVHDVANLYLAGSSVFPSAGHSNPTLTIVALAVRLARHLAGR